MGFTGKLVDQSIWHMNASAIAFDVGVHYVTPLDGLKLGMSVSNVGGKMRYEGKDNFIYYDYDSDQKGTNDKIFAEIKMDQWDLPMLFRVGFAYEAFRDEYHCFTFSTDAIHPNDYGESINSGFEYGYKDRFFLRTGYKSLFKKDSEEGLTAGIGLIYFLTDFLPMHVDYAYADFGRLNSVHRFTVEIGF
jgi:opacity protein-like surface antigen